MEIKKFVCPECEGTMTLTTSFNGWEEEWVDEETGEVLSVKESGRDSINSITYGCSQCYWNVDETEWEELYGE